MDTKGSGTQKRWFFWVYVLRKPELNMHPASPPPTPKSMELKITLFQWYSNGDTSDSPLVLFYCSTNEINSNFSLGIVVIPLFFLLKIPLSGSRTYFFYSHTAHFHGNTKVWNQNLEKHQK